MKEEISEYYKSKGYTTLYVAINKEPQRVATLRDDKGNMTSMSYAKYLYTSYYKCDVDKENNVDHINGDKMDDRIENLQVISKRYNIQKDHRRREMVIMVCPVCNEEFLYLKEIFPLVRILVVLEDVEGLNLIGNKYLNNYRSRFKS